MTASEMIAVLRAVPPDTPVLVEREEFGGAWPARTQRIRVRGTAPNPLEFCGEDYPDMPNEFGAVVVCSGVYAHVKEWR